MRENLSCTGAKRERVPVPVLMVFVRNVVGLPKGLRLQMRSPVWSVFSLFQNLPNQVEILIFFMTVLRGIGCGCGIVGGGHGGGVAQGKTRLAERRA